MLFVRPNHETVEVSPARRRIRFDRDAAQRRILRDRAMTIMQEAGLTLGEISEVTKAFAEGCHDRSHIRKRINLCKADMAGPRHAD